jgi:hypothetical protein
MARLGTRWLRCFLFLLFIVLSANLNLKCLSKIRQPMTRFFEGRRKKHEARLVTTSQKEDISLAIFYTSKKLTKHTVKCSKYLSMPETLHKYSHAIRTRQGTHKYLYIVKCRLFTNWSNWTPHWPISGLDTKVPTKFKLKIRSAVLLHYSRYFSPTYLWQERPCRLFNCVRSCTRI